MNSPRTASPAQGFQACISADIPAGDATNDVSTCTQRWGIPQSQPLDSEIVDKGVGPSQLPVLTILYPPETRKCPEGEEFDSQPSPSANTTSLSGAQGPLEGVPMTEDHALRPRQPGGTPSLQSRESGAGTPEAFRGQV